MRLHSRYGDLDMEYSVILYYLDVRAMQIIMIITLGVVFIIGAKYIKRSCFGGREIIDMNEIFQAKSALNNYNLDTMIEALDIIGKILKIDPRLIRLHDEIEWLNKCDANIADHIDLYLVDEIIKKYPSYKAEVYKNVYTVEDFIVMIEKVRMNTSSR